MIISSPQAKRVAAEHWMETQPEFFDFVKIVNNEFGTLKDIEISEDVDPALKEKMLATRNTPTGRAALAEIKTKLRG